MSDNADGLIEAAAEEALADMGLLSASPAPAGDLFAAIERLRNVELSDGGGGYCSAVMDVYAHEPVKQLYADIRAVIAAMQPGWRDKPHCQSCGGEIQGWTCQGCGLTFRENEAGRLVAEPLPAPPGVGG